MAPTLQLPRKDSHWFIEIYLRLCSSCPPYREDTPKLWWWGSNEKNPKPHVSRNYSAGKGQKACRSKRTKRRGAMQKDRRLNSGKTAEVLFYPYSWRKLTEPTQRKAGASSPGSVPVPLRPAPWHGDPAAELLPGTAGAGDGTGDSHGCFCSPKTFREYGKRGQVFLRKAGGIYSQLRSVESYYLPLCYAEPLVSPALVPQTKDDFENEGTTIKDTSK